MCSPADRARPRCAKNDLPLSSLLAGDWSIFECDAPDWSAHFKPPLTSLGSRLTTGEALTSATSRGGSEVKVKVGGLTSFITACCWAEQDAWAASSSTGRSPTSSAKTINDI